MCYILLPHVNMLPAMSCSCCAKYSSFWWQYTHTHTSAYALSRWRLRHLHLLIQVFYDTMPILPFSMVLCWLWHILITACCSVLTTVGFRNTIQSRRDTNWHIHRWNMSASSSTNFHISLVLIQRTCYEMNVRCVRSYAFRTGRRASQY